jgi:metallo-beta-lactamase class B
MKKNSLCVTLFFLILATLPITAGKSYPEIQYTTLEESVPVEPAKIFDNVYYLGSTFVGSFAIMTSKGIILIDSMNSSEDASDIIIAGLKDLGFDPANIKYVLVTHGHVDHFGGAHFIKEKYGAVLLMSSPDINLLHRNAFHNQYPKPGDFSIISDGQNLTLGDTMIRIISTPGHTPGTMSLIFSAKDNGVTHTVALWGGGGIPGKIEDIKTYTRSLDHFLSITDSAHVDASITVHPFSDNTNALDKFKKLKSRKTGDANLFVHGRDAYRKYMDRFRMMAVKKIEELEKK